VLYLAFGGPNLTAGGFFPNGVNGSLNTSASAAATSDSPTLTANPNPIVGISGVGQTTITWNAPLAKVVEIHIGSPNGPLFTYSYSGGSMQTGNWVTNGMTFYLQDVTNGRPLVAVNTLATLTVTVV
jgi:hypothetical protein